MQQLNFSPFPVFNTERLTLRQLTDSDAEAIAALRSNDIVNQYIDRAKGKSVEEALDFIHKMNEGFKRNQNLYWAICLKDSSSLIGTCCMWSFSAGNTIAEMGYELHPSFHRKGIIHEAVQPLIQYAFEKLGLQKLEAYTHRDNLGSIRLLQKNNFKQTERVDRENADNIVFILKS